jgi:PAS domain S-box-containing protein
MSWLFAPGSDPRPESRQIRLGLVALGVLGILLLNFVVYRKARNDHVRQRWADLAQQADSKRAQIRGLFRQLDRQARYLAEEPSLSSGVRAALSGTLPPEGQQDLQRELDRAAETFHLRDLVVLSPEGVLLAGTSQSEVYPNPRHSELVSSAAQVSGHLVADVHDEAGGNHTLEVAVPSTAAALSGRVPVLLLSVDADEELLPLLNGRLDSGVGSRAYLVRQVRDQVQNLTSADATSRSEAVTVPATEPSARAAAMAATGVESNVEFTDARGLRMCATTRFLPELGWGLVAQMDERVLMARVRGMALRLLWVEGAIGLCAVGLAWLWRRRFARGPVHEEVAVTHHQTARVHAIFETAFDAVVTFDRQGRVRAVNRAAESQFGRTAEEMNGQPLRRLLHWGATAGRSGPPDLPTPGVVYVAEALRTNGERFPVEFSVGQHEEGGERLFTAIVRDIRERVEAERRIREFAEGLETSNRRLEEANVQLAEASRLKSEFLANTSHELRTPLNGMIGFLQLVLDGLCDNREEELDFLKQALLCSRHLLGLINDVLDIARIESGKLQLEIEAVDIETLFQEVHTVTHVQAAQKGIALRFETPAQAQSVRCDMAKTKRVLINLVGNSMKFTPQGSITVKSVARPELGHVLFEVVDTGIGIPPDQQKIIFEKFAQGDGGTTRKYGGTGLGLAISRSLVELMGGIIGVDSEGPGKGTRMYFSLPIWSAEANAPELPPDQIEGPAGGPLILIVEDDPAFRKFCSALLHHHGYRTVEAASAEVGWVLMRRLRPAALVLDYALTCSEGARLRTGWDLAQQVAADPETRDVPFIFLTGFEEQVGEKLENAAFAHKPRHLLKPIDGAALVEGIEEMMGSIPDRQVRVLMADDDASVGAFVRKVLPDDRYHLEFASNGQECLEVLRTQPRGFDLLLLDLMMPEVSGYDVLREMTLTGAAASLPVLVLTNYPQPRSTEEKELLEQGQILDILSKTAVHDNPALLAHLVDWHLQVAEESEARAEAA